MHRRKPGRKGPAVISAEARQLWLRAHVPPPVAENLWRFAVGEWRELSADPALRLRLESVGAAGAVFSETLGSKTVRGPLRLNDPVCVAQDDDGAPMVAVTLRRIADGHAYLQITALPQLVHEPRDP